MPVINCLESGPVVAQATFTRFDLSSESQAASLNISLENRLATFYSTPHGVRAGPFTPTVLDRGSLGTDSVPPNPLPFSTRPETRSFVNAEKESSWLLNLYQLHFL